MTRAEASTTTLDLYAGEHKLRTVDVVVHALREVTNIVIEQNIGDPVEDEEGDVTVGGFARAVVLTDTAELVGVSVRWLEDGVEVGGGAWAEISGDGTDETHDIQACIGQMCATTTVPGRIVATFDTTAAAPPSAGGCSCGAEGLATWPAALGAWAFALGRRRRGS